MKVAHEIIFAIELATEMALAMIWHEMKSALSVTTEVKAVIEVANEMNICEWNTKGNTISDEGHNWNTICIVNKDWKWDMWCQWQE